MSLPFLKDAAERIVWTFVYAFVSALLATRVWDVDGLKAAAVASIPIVLVTVKALIARFVGNPDSAAIGGE